jgi:hypothetical protein
MAEQKKRTPKTEQSGERKTKSKIDKPKRGPARPHRRLPIDVLDLRIAKLQKRLERAKTQTEDASRHVEGYLRERDFREKEGSLVKADAEPANNQDQAKDQATSQTTTQEQQATPA